MWLRKDIYFPVRYEMYVKDQMVRTLDYRRIEKVNAEKMVTKVVAAAFG